MRIHPDTAEKNCKGERLRSRNAEGGFLMRKVCLGIDMWKSVQIKRNGLLWEPDTKGKPGIY